MTAPPEYPDQKKRTVGRPRRLTLGAIVDAACELGLHRLEMHLVAERLNTGVATLYGYVSGREQLEGLVFQRLAHVAKVGEKAATWQDVLREHAQISFDAAEASAHIVAYLINELPNAEEGAYIFKIVDKLADRGLSREKAISLYAEVTQVVIGAAISRARIKRVAENDPDLALPCPAAFGAYIPTVERIIRDHEREMDITSGKTS